MDCVQQFLHARVADLTVAQGIVTKALHSKTLPDWNDVPMDAVYTTLGAMVMVQVLVAMLTSKGRRLVLDTIETILAIGLILILLAIVVGLPIGIVYLGLKAFSFLLSLAMGVPFIANLAASVSNALGR